MLFCAHLTSELHLPMSNRDTGDTPLTGTFWTSKSISPQLTDLTNAFTAQQQSFQ